MFKRKVFAVAAFVLIGATPALAHDHNLGAPLLKDGMIINPLYIQAVHMAPVLPGINGARFDAHLEIDIHADKNNPYGYQPGGWIPYLTVSYLVQKVGSPWRTFGTMMAMTANDGPHYGANIRFDGPGKYVASFRIMPPPYAAFFRHTDKETGVPQWWAPIEKSWTVTYLGVGHKGGY